MKDGKPIGVTVSGNDLGAIAVSVVSANTVDESVSNNSVVIAGELTGNGTEQRFIVTKIEKVAKKGTYKVTITAKADKKYAKATKVITIKVK